jgi:hypothetical protein
MTTERARLCRCGCNVVLFPQWVSDYATYECMACVHGDSASVRANPALMKGHDYASAAHLQRKVPAPDSPWLLPGTMPPPLPPIDFPSKHVENARYWERRDEGLIDPAMIPDEAAEEWPQAVSQAQVYWARNQLRKAKNGAPVPQSIAELEALANTPLAGLPERAGKKPTRKRTAKKPAKKVREARGDAW